MNSNRHAAFEALREVLALHHARHRVARRELDHSRRAERVRPFAVVANLGARGVEHFARLRVISLRVFDDLLALQRRARIVATRRVTNHRGEIADQKDHGVTEVLKLTQLVQHHRVTNVQIRARRIKPQLRAQRRAGRDALFNFLEHLSFDEEFVTAALHDGELVLGGESGLCHGISMWCRDAGLDRTHHGR